VEPVWIEILTASARPNSGEITMEQ